VLDQLATLLRRTDLVETAIREAAAEIDAHSPTLEAERAKLDAEIARTDAAPDRCFAAFEKGTMPEQQCGERIEALSRTRSGLKSRREELTADEQDADTALTPEDIEALHAEITETIRDGDQPARKAPMRALVAEIEAEIRVESRQRIQPSTSTTKKAPPRRGFR